MTFTGRLALGSPLLIVTTVVVAAQRPEPPRALTTADYARAERFMNYNVTPLVLHSGVRPTWLPDDRFWYRTTTENGTAFFVVDPATGARSTCELAECTERNAEAARRRGRSSRPGHPG